MKINFFKKSNYNPKFLFNTALSLIRIFKFNREPVLVVGCARTGTSLMASILGAHPEIAAIQHESAVLYSRRKFKSNLLNSIRNKFWLYLILAAQGVSKTNNRWIEKTPQNLRKLSDIYNEIKSVKVIIMVRDGRDVTTSVHPKKEGYYVELSEWINDTKISKKYQGHSNTLLVPYELLVENFAKTMRSVTDFIGVPLVNEIDKYYTNTKIKQHDAFHSGQVKPIYNGSIGKWTNPQHQDKMKEFGANANAMELNRWLSNFKKSYFLNIKFKDIS